ncbi:MAG: hypothetical protein KAY00_06120 [Agitococcus sp.]|nr:hypothetical protein [Agitococcus sp.]
MSKLDSSAELVKLGQLLHVPSAELQFLEGMSLPTLIKIRELSTDKLFNDGSKLFQKLASASKLMPIGVTASIGEKIFGAMLCARIASQMPYQRAIDLAKKMTTPFLATVTLELDPRRVKDIIQHMPLENLQAVANELLKHRHYMVMGRLVNFMTASNLKVILNGINSEEALLHIGFFIEGKHQLSDIIRLLPKERLQKLISYLQLHAELWPEALALMVHLEDDLKREMGDISADLGEPVLNGLVKAVYERQLWQDALPLFVTMSPSTQLQLISTATLNDRGVLKSAITSTDKFALWATLLPLVEFMSHAQQHLLAELVMEEREDLQFRLIDAAYQHHLWQPLFDIMHALTEDKQHNIRVRFKQLALKDPQLVEKWQPLAKERGLTL